MQEKRNRNRKVPEDAVLLIPEPDGAGTTPAYGIRPGYYNRLQLLDLVDENKNEPDAICFIADMLETGDPDDDGFASLLRSKSSSPSELARIVQISQRKK